MSYLGTTTRFGKGQSIDVTGLVFDQNIFAQFLYMRVYYWVKSLNVVPLKHFQHYTGKWSFYIELKTNVLLNIYIYIYYIDL